VNGGGGEVWGRGVDAGPDLWPDRAYLHISPSSFPMFLAAAVVGSGGGREAGNGS
jgi:hypothetical protein